MDVHPGSGPRPDLLLASISADAQHAFSVTLTPSAQEDADHQYIRFALHYYARVLQLLARSGSRRSDLPAVIDLLLRTSIERDSDLFLLAGLEGSLHPSLLDPVAHADLSMHSSGAHECELSGTIELRGRTLAHSVIAVLQYLADRLSPASLAMLVFGLENMNSSYAEGDRHADGRGPDVPRLAVAAWRERSARVR